MTKKQIGKLLQYQHSKAKSTLYNQKSIELDELSKAYVASDEYQLRLAVILNADQALDLACGITPRNQYASYAHTVPSVYADVPILYNDWEVTVKELNKRYNEAIKVVDDFYNTLFAINNKYPTKHTLGELIKVGLYMPTEIIGVLTNPQPKEVNAETAALILPLLTPPLLSAPEE